MADRVEGAAELRRFLTVTVPDAIDREVRPAMERGADELVAEMKRLVPVKSGALRASIGWTWDGNIPDGAIGIDSLSPTGADNMQIIIYAGSKKAFWARWVEFGTAPHAQPKRGHQHPGAVGRPFFYPAYRKLKSRIKARITRAFNAAIRGLS